MATTPTTNKPKPKIMKITPFKQIFMTAAQWIAVPNHFTQKEGRDTRPSASHLDHLDPKHAIVHMAVYPDGTREKLDGHGRARRWADGNTDFIPDRVQVICIPVKDKEDSDRQFFHYDSKKACKRAEDYVYGALMRANIPASSKLFQTARGLATPLRYAFEVLNAATEESELSNKASTIDDHVGAFREALIALDKIDPRHTASKNNPCTFAGVMTTAFLLAFIKHGEAIVPFFKKLSDGDVGRTDGKLKDPYFAVKDFLQTFKIGAHEDHLVAVENILGALDTWMEGNYKHPSYEPKMDMQKIMRVDLSQYLLKKKAKRTGRTKLTRNKR
jgi:hypothetical protein